MEAVGYLATLESFRGVPGAALVRDGCAQAVVRAEVVQPDGRVVTIECELATTGRDRVLVNKQRLRRHERPARRGPRHRLLARRPRARQGGPGPAPALPGPDGGEPPPPGRCRPARPRAHPASTSRPCSSRWAGGWARTRPSRSTSGTPSWPRSASASAAPAPSWSPRSVPQVGRAYTDLADGGSAAEVEVRYEPAWRATGLAEALAAAKVDEVRRQVCLVGPHRDDLELRLNGLPARTHASQGEQRTLALALRLAAHRLVAERVDDPPVLRPRRRVLRARPGSQRGPPAPPPAGPGAADDGRSAPGRRGRRAHDPRGAGQADGMSERSARQARAAGSGARVRVRSAGSGSGVTEPDPRPLRDSLDEVVRSLRGTSARSLAGRVLPLGGGGRAADRGPREARGTGRRLPGGRGRPPHVGDAAAVPGDRPPDPPAGRGRRRRGQSASSCGYGPARAAGGPVLRRFDTPPR